MRGGIWKGDILVADIEELERMDASEIHAGRLNAKEVITPQNGEHFTFPIADGKVRLSGGDQVLRTSTLTRDSPERGEEREDLRGESDGSALQDSLPCDDEARNETISCQFLEITFTVITLNQEPNFADREKSHSQFDSDRLTWPALQVRPWT